MADLVRTDQLLINANCFAGTKQFCNPACPKWLLCKYALVATHIELFDVGGLHRPALKPVDPVTATQLTVKSVDECDLVVAFLPLRDDFINGVVDFSVKNLGRVCDRDATVRVLIGLIGVCDRQPGSRKCCRR